MDLQKAKRIDESIDQYKTTLVVIGFRQQQTMIILTYIEQPKGFVVPGKKSV